MESMNKIKKLYRKFIPAFLRNAIWELKSLIKRYVCSLFWFFPIKRGKIVFANFNGAGYGDNPKYIAEYLIRHGEKTFDLVWLVDKKREKALSDFPRQIRLVEIRSPKALYELATAHIWIDNERKKFFPKKKARQIYIQYNCYFALGARYSI